MNPSPEELSIARFVLPRFGPQAKVFRHADVSERNFVDVIQGPDFPIAGVTSYASIGLSRFKQRAGDVAVSVEL